MKPLTLMTFLLVILFRNVSAQILPPLSEDFFVIEGDTIINSSIQLFSIESIQRSAIKCFLEKWSNSGKSL